MISPPKRQMDELFFVEGLIEGRGRQKGGLGARATAGPVKKHACPWAYGSGDRCSCVITEGMSMAGGPIAFKLPLSTSTV
jgi:hypothetical protein